MDGWIKLHRQIQEDELYFKEKFTKLQAWMDLLLIANYKATTISIRGNDIVIGVGQLIYGVKTLSKRWRWSNTKVIFFMNWLERTGKVRYEKRYRICTITTIQNYEKYQGKTIQKTIQKRYRNDTDWNLNKNIKKDKKLLNISNGPDIDVSTSKKNEDVDLVLETYKKKIGKLPADKYPRRVAWNIVQVTNKFVEELKPYRTDLTVPDVIKKAFDWYTEKYEDYAGDKLEVVKRKIVGDLYYKTTLKYKKGDTHDKQI